MQIHLRALVAIAIGLRICFSDPRVRQLALWPWIIGAVCYAVSIYAGWRLHPQVVEYFINDTDSSLSWLFYWMVWLAAAAMVLGSSLILSILIIQLLTSGFQSAIAGHVLRARGQTVPDEAAAGFQRWFVDIARTMKVESAKLLIIIPCLIVMFALGFIPLLLPFVVAGTSWLLAFQFIDIVLDLFRIPVRDRFQICLKYKFVLICFGLSLTILWSIPLAGMLLAPAAAAGAAWLLSGSRLLNEALTRH